MGRLTAWQTGWFDYHRKRFWAWVLLALYALFGFGIAPLIARSVIVNQVHEQLGLTATLDDVDINPFALSARLSKFTLDDAKGERLLSFDAFIANVQLSSLVNRALTFSELRLVNPVVRAVRGADGKVNLAALIPPAEPNAKSKPESPPMRLIIEDAAIDAGRISVTDRAARTPYETVFGPVDLKISNFSTLPDHQGKQTLVMDTRFGGRLEWTGQMVFQPLHATGHVSLTGERLPEVSAYLPEDLRLSIVAGSLNTAFDYDVMLRNAGLAAEISHLNVTLSKLGLAQRAGATPAADLLRLAELTVQNGHLAWPRRSVTVDRVALQAPRVSLSRDAQQRFVWETLWQPPPGSAAAVAPKAATARAAAMPAVTAVAPPAASKAAAAKPDPEASPWSVAVTKFEVSDGQIGFNDHGVDPAATLGISALTASLDKFTSADGAAMPFALNFTVDGGGKVALNGTLTALPDVRVDAKSQISGLALNVANPYLHTETYLQLPSGTLDVDGHLVSNADELFGFDGALTLANLEMQREGVSDRFAGLKHLGLTGIKLSTTHREIDIARAELDSAFTRVHIFKDRTLNLAEVMRSDVPPAAGTKAASDIKAGASVSTEPAPDEKPWAVKLARLHVANADADFTDESLPIPFHRAISSIDGGIDLFDTASQAPTKLKLEGGVGKYGEMRLSGHVRALDPLLDTDITASFKNVEMPGASAYAIRFAGHKIASGKLDLDLHYVIRKGILDGSHKIVLRDFELGEKVPYPDALNLPYGLAISLLKDSSGNIDVDLPIEGDVEDPSFRIGGVIMKALGNLIVKIATSPFHLLGSLVGLGNSEDLDQIYFQPGSAELAPPEQEKVAKIAEALVLRPNLGLELHGVMNANADSLALRKSAVRARLHARVGDQDAAGRLKIVEAMAAESVPGLALDTLRAQFTVAPSPDAKPVFDETAYLDALLDKLVEAEPVAPGALDALATQRADAVRAGLATNASFDINRVVDEKPAPAELTKDGEVPMKLEVTAK